MDKDSIHKKFGNHYKVTRDTYIMGVHHILAGKIAQRFTGKKLVLDACVGAGFMAIVLAKYVDKVIAVDIDPIHLNLAKENAEIAGVSSKIDFMLGDVTSQEIQLKLHNIDCAFLDPIWTSGEDKKIHTDTLKDMKPSGDLLFDLTYNITNNVALRLPKEFNLSELSTLPPHEVEENKLDGTLKFYTVYFGDLQNS